MKAPIATVSTDATGLIVTFQRGSQGCPQFSPAWAGYGSNAGIAGQGPGNALQITIGGITSVIGSVQSGSQLTLLSPVQTNGSNLPMVPNRETLYQAFFNLVSQAAPFTTMSRVPNVWSNYSADQSPVLWQDQAGENQLEGEGFGAKGMPYKWELDVLLGIYIMVGDPNTVTPVSLMNPLLDSIEAAVNPNQPGGLGNTLNGLCYETRLLGKGKGEGGALVNTAWAYVPAVIRAM